MYIHMVREQESMSPRICLGRVNSDIHTHFKYVWCQHIYAHIYHMYLQVESYSMQLNRDHRHVYITCTLTRAFNMYTYQSLQHVHIPEPSTCIHTRAYISKPEPTYKHVYTPEPTYIYTRDFQHTATTPRKPPQAYLSLPLSLWVSTHLTRGVDSRFGES